MPVWLPFALVASLLVTLGAGQQAGWKTAADIEEEKKKRAAAQPPVQGRVPPKTTRGNWPFTGLPHRVTLLGRLFEKSSRRPPGGAVGVYSEVGGPGSVVVFHTGRFWAN